MTDEIELRTLFYPRIQHLQKRALEGDKPTYEEYSIILKEAQRWWISKGGGWLPQSALLKIIKGEPDDN